MKAVTKLRKLTKAKAKASLKRLKKPRLQFAALPYRFDDDLEILLVTSRDTGRWVIPKGWPMKGRKPHQAAAQEALEEAGVEGVITEEPIGGYQYKKRLGNGAELQCTVDVYSLEVERQRKRWPEQHQRTAHWFTPEEAAEAVHEPDLQELILSFRQQFDLAAHEGQEDREAPVLVGDEGDPAVSDRAVSLM